jgi:hypothetical protein
MDLVDLYEETVLTVRELEEVKHALFYAEQCNHGTVGHNMLILIAKLAAHAGITSQQGANGMWSVTVPGDITVEG